MKNKQEQKFNAEADYCNTSKVVMTITTSVSPPVYNRLEILGPDAAHLGEMLKAFFDQRQEAQSE